MTRTSRIALILGAGPNIGSQVAKKFADDGYQVALASRKATAAVEDNPMYLHIQGDLSQPDSVPDIFAQVRRLAGEPSVVVYNGKNIQILPGCA